MRGSRLLSIVLLLQVRGRMTAQQLAEELEVSVRTIYRDMESLSSAGIPLYGDAGHDGGYRLLEGYRTRLTGLTGNEAKALFLAGLPAADLGLGGVLATAQLKLMAALPVELREGAHRLQQQFHLDTSGWYTDPEVAPHLAEVVGATWNGHWIRVRYERWEQPREVTRVLAPYGLVLKSGRWYVVAADANGAARTYRVSQILRMEVLEETFERPDGFDLARHWDDYLEAFDTRRYQGEAVVRLSPEVMDELPHLLEPALVRAALATAQPPDRDGWITVTIPLESVGYTAGLLLRLGDGAEVLGPAELRERLTAIVSRLTKTYQF